MNNNYIYSTPIHQQVGFNMPQQVHQIQRILRTPIKTRLGQFNDVPRADENAIQNLNKIFLNIQMIRLSK